MSNFNKIVAKLPQKWYSLLMIERLVVGSCLVFMIYSSISALLPILVFLLFGIVAVIFKPYFKLNQTIRFVSNMAIAIVIEIIYLTYRLNP